jgi:arginyl-tRNA synthetase
VFHRFEALLVDSVSRHIRERYGVEAAIAAEQPKEPRFGDLALPVAFHLARQLRKAPKAIGSEIAAGLGSIPGVAALEVAGNGYINVRLDRGAYGESLLKEDRGQYTLSTGGQSVLSPGETEGKIIVEHTNINPNKAAHIGHLRNAVLGDTFVRMLRARGRRVETQNYIDNTGVQVADVVVGFHFLERKTASEVEELIHTERFDYVCWDLYARVGAYYRDNPAALAWRAETLHAVEAGEGEIYTLAALVADAIVRCHLATMWRLGIVYDVLPRESEILYLKFWETAFELLKQRQAIYLESEGKNAGCWVMPGSAFSGDADSEDSKVIVRSNGTVTYVGKDIAYQLWKFGLLGKDFFYRPWHTYDGHTAWSTAREPQPGLEAPQFGHGTRVYNVIDSRQSYLQDVVVAGLRQLGFAEQAERSVHFSYEMVALSPRSCAELGIELSEEDRRRPYVEMSGRKGLGVKADDLINKLIEEALAEVASRHPEDPPEKQRSIATQIAAGALRYFLLKYTRNAVIAFDFQEALSFEGETGPYVQYAAVRARSIWRKLEERGESVPDFARELSAEAFARQLAVEDFWQLALAASKADWSIERAAAAGEPAHVARYAFQLAQAFNNFYHAYPVITEENRERKVFLLWLTGYVRERIERTLNVLGIEVPEYM